MSSPQKLYKYQPFALYAITNLKNNRLYFNHPDDFNDPYDTTQEVLVKELNREAAKDLFFGQYPERNDFELVEESIAKPEKIIEIAELLSKSSRTFRLTLSAKLGCLESDLLRDVENFSQTSAETRAQLCEHIVNSFYNSLNSTVKESLEIIRAEKVSAKGVCCFSEEVDNLLMWSYYADGHKGFCLEFDTAFDPFTKLHQVKYVQDLPIIDANKIFTDDNDHNGIVESLLATKFLNWRHEKEWRVLHTNSRQEFGYKSNALTGVYFGSKMSLSHLEIIALIIQGQNKYCKFYQMVKEPGSFRVVPTSFTYTSFQDVKDLVYPFVSKHIESGIRDLAALGKDLNLSISNEQLYTVLESLLDDYDHEIQHKNG